MNDARRSDFSPLAPALVLFGGLAVLLVLLFMSRPTEPERPAIAALPTDPVTGLAVVPADLVEPVAATGLDPQMVSRGETTFQTICAACHGFNALGISGLGKTLVNSDFVNNMSDDDLLNFIIVGREVIDPLNTTGVPMPARGGNPALSDDDLRAVVAYIRSLNGEPIGEAAVASAGAAPGVEATGAPVAALPPVEFTPLDLGALNLPSNSPIGASEGGANLFSVAGQAAYTSACSACHGLDGEGVPYLAASLSESASLREQDGIALFEFLTREEPPVNPEQAYPHPARGGYPPLSDEQIQSIIAYLYTLPAAQP